MNKRWTAMLLALALCGSLAACGAPRQEETEEDKPGESQTVQPETPEENKTEDAGKDKTDPAADTNPPAQTEANTAAQPAAGSSSTNQSKPQASTPAPAPAPAPTPTPEPAPAPQPAPAPEPTQPTAAQASGYIGGSASALEGALGSPNSKSYSPSCMGEGEDGIWSYGSFTVYTYRENGVETVEAVQ